MTLVTRDEPVPLRAVVLVCTLKGGQADSSSEKLGREVVEALAKHGHR